MSPDGKRIAFCAVLNRRAGVRLMSIDGTAARILIEDACLPSWSPDGKRLAFARERGDAGVYIVHVEAGDARKIVR